MKAMIITGASSGIGTALCKCYAENGYYVFGSVRNTKDAKDLNVVLGDKGESVIFDVTKKDQIRKGYKQIAKKTSKIEILINNAGFMSRGDITQTSDEDYELSMKINVEAPFRLIRAAIPVMAKAGGGSIVNISSCWGINPGPNHLIYCTTKAALAAMTKCLGRDHAHQNIRINAVCPNEVNTPMLRTGFEIRGLNPDDAIEKLNQSVPIGHIAEPDEIADVVSFLSSNEARYICGSLVEINGGKAVY